MVLLGCEFGFAAAKVQSRPDSLVLTTRSMPHPSSTDYQDAASWLYDRIDYERLGKAGASYRFTLDRMRDLVHRLGQGASLAPASDRDPELPQVIHIAGTKGKGSTANMVAAMLTAGGFKTGLYTSPHLVRLEERFRVDGEPASEAQMVDLIHSLQPIVDRMASEPIGGPSFFELTTAIAIEHFRRSGCRYWVLETGLGGRLDSTNVFQSDVTVITSIGLDHQHVLGNTVDKIAKEKAGIFKPGVPAISGVTQSPARDVIREHARQLGVELNEIDRDFQIRRTRPAAWGSEFCVHSDSTNTKIDVKLNLEGHHQVQNAALAIEALGRIDQTPATKMLEGLATLQIDARLERFEQDAQATVILDAAHNPDSVAALLQTIGERYPGKKLVGVFGTSVDKNAAEMIAQLESGFDRIVLTRYHKNPRFIPTETLAELAGSTRPWWSINDHPIPACRQAINEAGQDGIVVVCGSFFLAAEVRPWLVSR